MANSSIVILCKGIKMDRNYINVLNYSEQQMLELCRSKKMYEKNDYSFIRSERNTISVKVDYGTALQCNYLAFQNKDYSNKWFFAWINEVSFTSPGVTKISFTVDSWSTWWDKWTLKPCYVIREHVNNDTVGANLVPEDMNIPDYTVNEASSVPELNDCCVVMGVVGGITGQPEIHGGVFSGLAYVGYNNTREGRESLRAAINSYVSAGKAEEIYTMFEFPKSLCGFSDTSIAAAIDSSENPMTVYKATNINSTLDGYTPKNKKLLTYPFNYLLVSNNNGSNNIYKYEKFEDKNDIKFQIKGVVTTGGSVRLFPIDYGGIEFNHLEGLDCGKFPTCSWATDSYTNWLTQNGVNIAVNVASAALSVASGLGTASIARNAAISTATKAAQVVSAEAAFKSAQIEAGVSAANSVGDLFTKFYQASIIPDVAKGNTNNGDVNFGLNLVNFTFNKMSLKKEYAKMFDDFFTRYGYKVNTIKRPNLSGRQNWNYVEIGENSEIGYGDVPSIYMEEINGACRKGITIWHNHDNLGDFSLSNNII